MRAAKDGGFSAKAPTGGFPAAFD
jgi:hypothetical protein